jgi:hypothetical protein
MILQKPFKHGFKQEFDVYTTNNIDKQLDEKEAKDVKLHFHMFVLRPLLYLWLFQAWQHVNQPNMIKRGWLMSGLEQAFNKTLQTSAMDEHMKNPIFKEISFEEITNLKGKRKRDRYK